MCSTPIEEDVKLKLKTMKVKDFEKAIDALSADITIDEMKLRHSDVRQVNGHNSTYTIIWDEYGRSFTANKTVEETYIIPDDEGKTATVNGYPLQRDAAFDLKF